MTTQKQDAGAGKKCIHILTSGTRCDQDALSNSNYCADHGPRSAGHSGGGSFGTGKTMYTQIPTKGSGNKW